MSRQPEPPASITNAIARQMHAQLEALMASDYHEGNVPRAYEQHSEMWLARSEPYARAVWDALLAEGFHVWRRCPTCVLQTEQMMGYGDRAEHFWVIPLPVVEPRDTEQQA